MKKLFALLIASATVIATGCDNGSKDSDNPANDIIGTWKVTGIEYKNLRSSTLTPQELEEYMTELKAEQENTGLNEYYSFGNDGTFRFLKRTNRRTLLLTA